MRINKFLSLDWRQRLEYFSGTHSSWYRLEAIEEVDPDGIVQLIVRPAEDENMTLIALKMSFLGYASVLDWRWLGEESIHDGCMVVEFQYDNHP